MDCTATYHGLHEWHKHLFEHLGWMLLAKEHGRNLKIKSYTDSVKRLKYCLEKKIKQTRDSDRRDDLIQLLENVNVLQGNLKLLLVKK
jgi:hypothetical protein